MTETYRTSLGTSSLDSIQLLGKEMATELMGEVSFGDLAFWLVALRRPTKGESRLFNAILVALADHGFTPTVLAARLTLTSAPESIQGAMAAGILGGGSRFLGVTEDAAKFLAQSLSDAGELGSDSSYEDLATQILYDRQSRGLLVPGLGHPVHKNGDPRTPVIYKLAAEAGVFGTHLSLLAAIERVQADVFDKHLPVNGAGACGAALADLGFPPGIIRGFALVARSAGLLGQIAEEMRDPIGLQLYAAVDRNARYVDPSEVLYSRSTRSTLKDES
ncbi:citryl-CoA lyase [Gordonia terrae]|uniref:citryl-CoA lyase n=1 Tax=Gordonia hongkongensis TaxID=1701090 RepID=UPI0022B4F373|nr:citryl-CoA lyase [Gordonia terrae]